ncbi:MAG TPA: Rieske 2Fe-2S domain-containing protein [Dehalococcoidia bacterium]|nr:Rieske 2Fe-2S domain-containing protein [Dehalococcoidia bacterium]
MLTKEENDLLTRTGPGTPMGELFRRFWLPALLSTELPEPDCPPVKLMILSEDLVAFRDSEGRVGVLDRYCPHRGSSLFWGRNEESGLRCVYHGWKFDVAGSCVDMPNEPPESRFKEKIRTTAYPTEERGGVIWVYMGPRDVRHAMPELEWTLVPEDHRYVTKRTQACNYLQNVEGEVDSSHVSFLHSRRQPSAALKASEDLNPLAPENLGYVAIDKSPVFKVKDTDYGLLIGARRNAGDDSYYWRLTQFLMPSYTMIPSDPDMSISWTGATPVDDEHMIGFTATWRPDCPLTAEDIAQIESWRGIHSEVDPRTFRPIANKDNNYLIDRRQQGSGESFTGIRGIREQDMAVQEDQWGPVTRREREHLGTTDLAVIAMRRVMLREAQRLQQGIEPREAANGAAYRVRSLAHVLKREVDWQDGARELLQAKVGAR